MNSVRTITILFSLLSGLPLQGQNQTIGYIDSDRIIEQMPEYEGIEQRLNLLSESWREEIRELDREIDALKTEFEDREVLYTDEMRESRRSDIQDHIERRDRLIEERFGPGGDYFRRQQELLESIQRQVFEVVNHIANRDGFDFILDRSSGSTLFFAGSEWDLTDEVLFELGIRDDVEN